ncbi:MAG TPA: flagellar hook-basal body complex protein FliE [Gammaproteobacteria bacterium]|nr:flagellar hook-basal body complex protein FliE [Gammaproteobacteria bacterium]
MSSVDVNQVLAQMRAMAAAAQSPDPGAHKGTDAPAQSTDFAGLLKQSIDQVNQYQKTAGHLTDAFAKGDPQSSLSDVMVALQKANVSFEAMLQVRNKLVAAYQEVMNMQV